jgi:amidase
MKVDDYRRHDALGLAALISRGEVGAAQVLEAAIAAADAADPGVRGDRPVYGRPSA